MSGKWDSHEFSIFSPADAKAAEPSGLRAGGTMHSLEGFVLGVGELVKMPTVREKLIEMGWAPPVEDEPSPPAGQGEVLLWDVERQGYLNTPNMGRVTTDWREAFPFPPHIGGPLLRTTTLDGWVPHDGGECPVGKGVRVEVRLPGDDEYRVTGYAGGFDWSKVTHFRLVPPVEEVRCPIGHYVNEYVYIDDDNGGEHEPTEWERALIADAIAGAPRDIFGKPAEPAVTEASCRTSGAIRQAANVFSRNGEAELHNDRSLGVLLSTIGEALFAAADRYDDSDLLTPQEGESR